VNLRSVFLCCKHGIPHLLEADGGSVINMASFVATMGAAVSQISYTASKGAVLSMSRELGVEFARRGVRVKRALPWARQHSPAARAVRQRPRARGPAPRAPPDGRSRSRPRSPGRRSSWRATDSSYVTASTFLVDGGISAAYITPQ